MSNYTTFYLIDKEFNYIEQLKDHWDFRISNVKFKSYKIEEPNNVDILEYGDFLKLTEGKYSGQIRNNVLESFF